EFQAVCLDCRLEPIFKSTPFKPINANPISFYSLDQMRAISSPKLLCKSIQIPLGFLLEHLGHIRDV
ncbi:MAG: hypothetical protein ACK2T3_11695, partial [Candidatus Promineifilaceae bacterium]